MPDLPFKQVRIICKTSLFAKHILRYPRSRIAKLYAEQSVATRKLKLSHEQHERSCEIVQQTLKKFGIPYKTESGRYIKPIQACELVITVGGDGTFLRTSHQVKDQLILGINSAPIMSRGALCSAIGSQFPKKWESIMKGQYTTRNLWRLTIEVNGKNLKEQALNDVLYSNIFPAGTSRYLIRVSSKQEEQKSSGVWVATASGSSAAVLAAGGKRLSILSKKIQFAVREPYPLEANLYQLKKGFLDKTPLQIINKTLEAALYIDGLQRIVPLQFGDHISIYRSPEPLHVLW